MSSVPQNLDTFSAKELALKNEIEQEPNNVGHHLNLAAWLRRHSRAHEAAEQYRTALLLQPDDSTIALKLAATLIESAQYLAAEELLQKLVLTAPTPPGAFYELGKLRFLSGQVDEAIGLLNHALQLEPQNAECCAFLGHVFSVVGNKDQAMVLFERSAQLEPTAGEPWRHMALLVQEQLDRPDRYARAEEYLKRACDLEPENPVFHCAYGDLLLKRGRLKEALACYNLAKEVALDFPLAVAGAISVLERLGDFSAAAELASDALSRHPDHPSLIQSFAPLARHIGQEQRAVELLEKLLATPNLASDKKLQAHFALGKLYDRLQIFDKAFENFEQGNLVSGFSFDRDRELRRFDDIIQAFPSAAQRSRPRASNRSRVPVFIVGMPRSGTTLVEQIIASHSLAHGAGELENISDLARDMHRTLGLSRAYPFCAPDLNRRQLDVLAQNYLDFVTRVGRGKPRVTDKMPHNFLALGLIDLLFPAARVIHCRRDPVDNCVGIFTQPFSESHGYAARLSDLGWYYGLYDKIMTHWAATIRVPMLEVRYEELVSDPETHIRQIIAFCGLPWEDRCLRFHEAKRDVNTLSYDQVRRPIYTTSIGRWRNYAAFLQPLMESLGSACPQAADKIYGIS